MAQIGVRLPDALIEELDIRNQSQSLPEVIRESLARYFTLLSHERRMLKPKFSPGELSLLADICNGTMFPDNMIPLGLLADAEDAEQEYYSKWGVDRAGLLSKLRALTPCQEAALVDAVERFWTAVSTRPTLEQPQPGKLLD